jgi:uncharacterized protein
MDSLVKTCLIVVGSLCVALGVLGIFLPVLPTTPFLLLAAFCYARSSQRLHEWLLENRWFGEYLKNYHEGHGMRLRHKVLALAVMWASIGWTTLAVIHVWWGKLMLLLIAFGVTVHLLRMRNYKPGASAQRVTRMRLSQK